MNLLFIYPTIFNPIIGGVERVTDMLAHELQKRGYRIFYLHTHKPKEKFSSAFETYFFESSDYNDIRNRKFYHNFLKSKNIDFIINQCGAHKDSVLFNDTDNTSAKSISVIHFNPSMNYNHYWQEIYHLRNNTYIEKLKRIVRCVLFWKLKTDYRKRLCQHYNWLFKNTDKICILSDHFQDELRSLSSSSYTQSKVTVIGNPVSHHDNFDESKENIVLWVGRFDIRQKKPDLCLKIWKKIQSQFQNWKLIMVGDGKDFNYITSHYSNIPNVEFIGYADPNPFYKRAKILMMTSAFEGWGMVLTEAISHNVVPIAFESFLSVRDLITNSRQLVKPFDIEEYSSKLLWLMDNSTSLKHLSLDGWKIIEKYTLCNIVNQWDDLFKSMSCQ